VGAQRTSDGALNHAQYGGRPKRSARLVHLFDTLRVVTDVPRRAARRPRSLTPEQLTHSSVTSVGEPVRVTAWIVWEDGVEELLVGHAVAWTPRAVQVRFGVPPHQHEAWVWAGAVCRARFSPGGVGRCFLGAG
jgi:hypothetical protein